MIAVHMEPLEAKAAREQARVDALDAKLRDISGLYNENLTYEQASIALEMATYLSIDETYAERRSVAMTIKLDVIAKLEQLIPLAKQREAEAEELARITAEREKQELLAKQAEDIAKAVEVQKREIEAKAQAEIQAAQKREADALAKAEESRKQAEFAAQQERQRVIDEQKAKQAAEQERTANIEHRRSVNREVLNALIKNVPLSEENAKRVIECIVRGEIPNVIIAY
jgi:hypothetical protein